MSEDAEGKNDKVQFIESPKSTGRRLVFADAEQGSARYEMRSFDRSSVEEEEEEPRTVLDPDHPLLEKFQHALKQHLLRQIEHLQSEVFELETGAKKKNQAREELGIETYDAQQLVNKQQEDLEMCVAELDHICSATEQLEFELEETKNLFAEKRLELLEAEKKELHLRTEMDGLNLMMHQMKQWETDIESELTINQRVFEKTKKDKVQLAVEKRELDMIVYKLMTETWRLEEELETMDMQLRVKEEEREKLAESVTSCNIDVETLNTNYRCLLHSWNSLIVSISQRDKQYSTAKQEIDALNEKMSTMGAELEQTKKLCQKEMLQNERLTDIRCRIQADIENCVRLLDLENKKRDNLETQMNATQVLLDQTENDIQRMSADNLNKNNALALLFKEFERLSRHKVSIEDQILKNLEDQITNNKAAKYLNKLVHDIMDKNRDYEITLGNIENSNAKTLMDIEAQKCINEETQRFLDDIIKQQKDIDDQVKQLNDELERLRFLANRKQRDIDVLTTKIEAAINKQGGLDVSPEEVKIMTLEKNIVEVRDRIKHLQKFWLRQQGYVVSLSQQRQDQINDINMLNKQMQLLIQKNLKINDELIAYHKQEEQLGRLINNLQNRLVVLNEELCKKKGNKNMLTKDNDSMQYEYVVKLQESEMESLKIEADIADIEEDKVNLSEELIERNREALAWEKKIQMAVETKKNMDEEKGTGGEVGNMKAEIHRMHVRFGQLKKAQDKLIHDLEHCVSRRDAIITLNEAREKREKGGSEKTRLNFARKLDDMRNKIKQMENEIEITDKKIEEAEKEEQRILEEIAIAQQDTETAKQRTEVMQQKMEQAKTDRQRNLELLVLKQKKLKVYSELSKGRNPYIVYRTERVIMAECDKQKILNNKLLNIMENLLSDFPNYYQSLIRISNTLKLPNMYLYQ